VVLAGGANLVRDPATRRNFEFLSEDPLLTGLLVGATINGIQSQGVASTIKHFALNNQETGRFQANVLIDPAAARESDLLAFQIGIEQGKPASVMCSYNLVAGAHTCGNDWLLNDVLKRDWGYKGWVMSDWGAVHSTDALLRGLDQNRANRSTPRSIWATCSLPRRRRIRVIAHGSTTRPTESCAQCSPWARWIACPVRDNRLCRPRCDYSQGRC
jgi:beta-glucosidase